MQILSDPGLFAFADFKDFTFQLVTADNFGFAFGDGFLVVV